VTPSPWTYGEGIPRYLALWLPLTPVLVVILRRARVPWPEVGVVVASTLPTFALHPPSSAGPPWLRIGVVVAVCAVQAAWLARTLRAPSPPPGAPAPARSPAPAAARRVALALAVLVALAVRVPLAWADPGIGDFGTASDTAARQLLAGRNPWLEPNPHATVGAYQYPAGTVLAHLPTAALLPREVGGEPWLSARAAVWVVDVAAVLLLGRWSPVLAWAWALHPGLVRESGIVVANDVLLTLLAGLAALALARRRHLAAAVATGLAIAVKPSALVLVPLLLAAAGPPAALVACAVPAVLQLPFLLLPRPGLHGLAAVLEPAARLDPGGAVPLSAWLPLLPDPGLLGAASAAGVAAALGTAWVAGRALRRRGPTPSRAAAAVALPLLAAFALATRWPTNFALWPLAPLLVAVAATARPEPPAPGSPPSAGGAGARVSAASPARPATRR